MSAPLNERLRKAAANVHADLPEDLVARVERQDTLSELLLEAAEAIDGSNSNWQDVTDAILNGEILFGKEGARKPGDNRQTQLMMLIKSFKKRGYRMVKLPEEP